MSLKIADRAYIVENGVVVLEGPCAELQEDERVMIHYVGRKST